MLDRALPSTRQLGPLPASTVYSSGIRQSAVAGCDGMLTLSRRPCQILFMESGLRVIGAGLSRTGTRSLALALERLLGARCYHMSTVFEREFADVPEWLGALDGRPIEWTELFAGCAASVDWA